MTRKDNEVVDEIIMEIVTMRKFLRSGIRVYEIKERLARKRKIPSSTVEARIRALENRGRVRVVREVGAVRVYYQTVEEWRRTPL